MIGARGLGLTLFAVWVAWLVAVQALALSAVAGPGLGPFVPDLALVLAVGLVARGHPRDVPALALLWAFGRAAFAVDPPFAILAGTAGALALARAARSVVETHGALPRTLVAGACALVFHAWLIGVHLVRHESLWGRAAGGAPGGVSGDVAGAGVAAALLAAWPAAASTALAALVVGPALAHLPGLTPLRRSRW